MTGTVIKLLNADTCAFSQVEAEVLRRVSEGDKITSISSEMGLAEPIVMEYIRSILRKVRTRDAERMTGLDDIRTLLEEGLSHRGTTTGKSREQHPHNLNRDPRHVRENAQVGPRAVAAAAKRSRSSCRSASG